MSQMIGYQEQQPTTNSDPMERHCSDGNAHESSETLVQRNLEAALTRGDQDLAGYYAALLIEESPIEGWPS